MKQLAEGEEKRFMSFLNICPETHCRRCFTHVILSFCINVMAVIVALFPQMFIYFCRIPGI
jgi:hypothetical protein